MKIADLFAKLSIQPDGASFKAGDRMLGGLRNSVKLAGKGFAAFRSGLGNLGNSIKQGIGQGIGQGIFSKITGAIDGIGDTERGLTRFQIAGDLSSATMEGFRAALSTTARESGVARDKILAGASAYQALTGDTQGAIKATSLFGKVANATGADVEDIGAVMGALKTSMHILPDDMEAAFSTLHVQGKAGAVELKDQATLLASVLPAFSKFKGADGIAGMAQAGAALQVARNTFGSPEEAATGVKELFTALTRGSKKLAKKGVKIYDVGKDGVKRMRAFGDIITSIGKSGFAKDESELLTALGSSGALATYKEIAKSRDLYDDLVSKASDRKAIEKDAAKWRESAPGRFDKVIEGLKTAATDLFTPSRIDYLVSGLEKVVGALSTIIDGIASATKWTGEKLGQIASDGPFDSVTGFLSSFSPGASGLKGIAKDTFAANGANGELNSWQARRANAGDAARWGNPTAERLREAGAHGFTWANSAGASPFAASQAAQGKADPMMLANLARTFAPAVEAFKDSAAGKSASSTTIGELTNTVNVIAKGGDPKQIAAQVGEVIAKFWRDRMAEFEGGAAAQPAAGGA